MNSALVSFDSRSAVFLENPFYSAAAIFDRAELFTEFFYGKNRLVLLFSERRDKITVI